MTEECFNEGHLKFHGTTAWIQDKTGSTRYFDPEGWTSITAVRTTEGTYPEGSEWTKIELPLSAADSKHWAFWDKVEVPEDLKLGSYVLSFRWDCQGSKQVWMSCANINVVD